jgi:hypothetical protein
VKSYVVEPSPKAWAVETGAETDPTLVTAFAFAMANKHKPWARRWLRTRRESFHG